jgi:uncharacterized tellurite resistance protein B-like protein
VIAVQQLSEGKFLLRTATGQLLHAPLDYSLIAEFRDLGGPVSVSSRHFPSELPPDCGFFATGNDVYYWLRSKNGAIFLGPVLFLEQIDPYQFCLTTQKSRHKIVLPTEAISEFQRLGGLVAVPDGTDGKSKEKPSVAIPLPARRDSAQPNTVTVRANPIVWHGAGSKFRLGPYVLTQSLVYSSVGQAIDDDASCIDVLLPVGGQTTEPPGALGYWPQYRTISPSQRANYLSWLAHGRKSELTDIGYAFIYFYGLERRLLLENKDVNDVFPEVVRLLHRYTFSGSFTGYLSRFLTYTMARTGIEKLKADWFNHIFEKCPIQLGEEILALGLAWHLKSSRPLSASWAMRMARQHPQIPWSVVPERIPQQFQALFTKKYNDTFGNGMQLKAAKRDLKIDYPQPASPTLLNLRRGSSAFADCVKIPNVLGLQSQFLPLVKIWFQCVEVLKPLSRKLAKGLEIDSREAFEALPDELKCETDHPEKAQWQQLAAEHSSDTGYIIVPIAKLAGLHGISQRRKLTVKQSQSLGETADYVGYALEPDARLHHRQYAWDDFVALYRREEEQSQPGDNRYTSAATLLELGLAVVAGDEGVSAERIKCVVRFLEDQFRLDQAKARRLNQLAQVYIHRHPSMAGIARRLFKSLSQAQRQMLARFLVAVVAAHEQVKPTLAKALRRAYRALGVDASLLDVLLEDLHGPNKAERATAAADVARPDATDDNALNQDKIRQIMADTESVAGVLDQIMGQPDDDGELDEPGHRPLDTRNDTDFGTSRFPGLHTRFEPLLSQLLGRDAWPRGDFETLIRAHGHMPAAAIAAINEWAEERHGELLIEEDDPFRINRSLIQDGTCRQ